MAVDKVRTLYPRVAEYFGKIRNGNRYLEHILEVDSFWQNIEQSPCSKVVLQGSELPEDACIADEYDLVYAGGTLGLLHAAVMASKYGRKVLVFDRHVSGKPSRDWNISRDELEKLEQVGLLSYEEINAIIACRYKTGWAEFYVENGRKKRLYLDNVLDCAIESDQLLSFAKQKILTDESSRVIDKMTFMRCFQFPESVVIEVENSMHERVYFRAKVFVDAMGVHSSVAMQLNDGASFTHLCPTVGTVSSGLENVEPDIGEILVSTEPADTSSGRGRQLIWEGFPAGGDRYTTYLFFYDSRSSDNDKSLLGLFETYFRKLPSYKKPGKDFVVHRPVYGVIPAYYHDGFERTRQVADNNILMLGDAAALGSPLTFCGFGSFVRNLKSLTEGLERTLASNGFEKKNLEKISAYEPNVAAMANLMKYMCYNKHTDHPNFVNELMNEVMIVLDGLPPRYREAMFKDTLELPDLLLIGLNVAWKYPGVLTATASKLGLDGSLGMMKNMIGWAMSSKASN
ncbi:MAG: hypothetical protein FJZ79_09100 [Chlorobi bacterium]|nr:hypothetical protein [Chlorobiota bacterium]